MELTYHLSYPASLSYTISITEKKRVTFIQNSKRFNSLNQIHNFYVPLHAATFCNCCTSNLWWQYNDNPSMTIIKNTKNPLSLLHFIR